MSIFAAAGLLSVLVLLAFWSVLRKAVGPGGGKIDFSRIEDFSIQDYRPMQRLLSGQDSDFLIRQPGYEAAMGARLGRQRRAIYRSYLRALCDDFEMLHRAVRVMVASAPEDQPGLVWALIQQSARFHLFLALAYLQLGMHGAGLGTVPVNAESLIRSTGWMRTQLQSLIPLPGDNGRGRAEWGVS